MVRGDIFQHIEADGIGVIREIEIADLVVARGRHERERFFGKVAMRIDKEKPVAAGDVLRHDIEKKRGLADAGRTEDCHVAEAFVVRERHGLAVGVSPIWVCAFIAGTISEARATGRGGTA